MKTLLSGLFVSFLFALPLYAQEQPPSDVDLGPAQYLLTPAEAIQEIFGTNVDTRIDTIRITQQIRDTLATELHRSIPDSTYIVQQVFKEGNRIGYAMEINEYGKYRPITMLVGVDADFQVEGVRILVYRENRGGEVQRERFLYQYRNMTTDDPVRINQDIINISGATISVRGVNAGVRLVLHLLEAYYGQSQ
ncbi:MAG: FMN-binding protein [Candidatus Marinimicrobia bacterium]|nr:FMN-binding protein [Candidatus Neomarinimicrobiota bacterium]MCF7829040.1 FMN-binding protein [Candidatus Neomarinimicrobiota bacterium]MCF7881823.1 FMN-binding protein [Candidatus Neomarinimicrobiota bacterium]